MWHCPHLLMRAVLRRGCCRAPVSIRSISPALRAHSSEPAAAACSGQRTDGRTFNNAHGTLNRKKLMENLKTKPICSQETVTVRIHGVSSENRKAGCGRKDLLR